MEANSGSTPEDIPFALEPVSHDPSTLPFRYGVSGDCLFKAEGLLLKLLAPNHKQLDCPGEVSLHADGRLLVNLTIDEAQHFRKGPDDYENLNALRGAGVYAKSDSGAELRIGFGSLISYKLEHWLSASERAMCTYNAEVVFCGPAAVPSGRGKLVVPLINFHAYLREPVKYPDGFSSLSTNSFSLSGRHCHLFIERDSWRGPGKETSFCTAHLEYEADYFQEARERDFVSKLALLLSLATGRWAEPGGIFLSDSSSYVLLGSKPGSGTSRYFPIGGMGYWNDLNSFLLQAWKKLPESLGMPLRVMVRYFCYMLSVEVWEIQLLAVSALLETLKFHYAAALAIKEGKVKSIGEFTGKLVQSDREFNQPPFDLLYRDCRLWRPKSAPRYPSLARALGADADVTKLKLFKQVYRNSVVHTGTIPNFQDKDYEVARYAVDFAVRLLLRWVGYRGRYNPYGSQTEGQC